VRAHEAGRPAEALAQFEDALSLDPADCGALVGRGHALEDLERPDEAIDSFRQALAVDPAYAPALDPLCRLLRARQREADVAAVCRAALAAAPELAQAHVQLGLALLTTGDPRQALAHFERAVAAEPASVLAYQGRSAALARLGRRAAAQAAAREANRLRPVRSQPRTGTPIGSVLVLRCAEHHWFDVRNGRIGLCGPINSMNAPAYLDRRRFHVHTAFVDALRGDDPRGSLPAFDLVFNAIADPDVSRRSLERARTLLAGSAAPVINRPEAVLATTRDGNWRRFRDLPGIVVPKAVKVVCTYDAVDRLRSVVSEQGFRYPVIARRIGTHAGMSAVRIDDGAALAAYAAGASGSVHYLTQYVECSPDGRYHRRARLFWIDGAFYPLVMDYNEGWNVHSGSRSPLMDENSRLQAEERAFVDDPAGYLGAAAISGLRALGQRAGLEFFGIDLAPMPGGEALIFEVSAAMDFHPMYADRFPYLRAAYDRVIEAVNRLAAGRMGHTA
jgi:Tfp pilus assembly protein PilF